MAAKKNKKSKSKKVSTDDFLDLLDDQERARGPMAFKPKKVSQGGLTPIQQEWVNLAIKLAPRPVSQILSKVSDRLNTYLQKER